MADTNAFISIEQTVRSLASVNYIADRPLAVVLFLAWRLKKPVFIEGEPGVGKTEAGTSLARLLDTELIRLQCYEGLDASAALYEWNYPKQLLNIRIEEREDKPKNEIEKMIYGPDFLIERPLLKAINRPGPKPPVLLIDEVDRADEEFEAFLLEVLSDFQVTIPELGTLKAKTKPLVVITSNRTRDVHDALKRRCLYHWIEYPDFAKEKAIIAARLPAINTGLAEQVVSFMQRIRTVDFLKKPGVSESLDWAQALMVMEKDSLDPDTVQETLGCILKYQDDIQRFTDEIWADPKKRAEFLSICA